MDRRIFTLGTLVVLIGLLLFIGAPALASQGGALATIFRPAANLNNGVFGRHGVCNQSCDPAHPSCDPGLSCVREPDGGHVCWGGTDSTGQSCGAQPTGGHCNQQCDPAHPSCDAGLSCVTEPDGGHVCFGGTDANGFVCGGSANTGANQPGPTQAPGGHCNQPCNPAAPSCDAGLSCVTEPDGGHVCFGGRDATGQTCGGSQPTGGHCNQACNPAAPSCDPGLSCVTEPDGGHVCFGGTDATGQTCGQTPPHAAGTQPVDTTTSTEQPTQPPCDPAKDPNCAQVTPADCSWYCEVDPNTQAWDGKHICAKADGTVVMSAYDPQTCPLPTGGGPSGKKPGGNQQCYCKGGVNTCTGKKC